MLNFHSLVIIINFQELTSSESPEPKKKPQNRKDSRDLPQLGTVLPDDVDVEMFESVQDEAGQVGATDSQYRGQALVKVQSKEVGVGEVEVAEVGTVHHRVQAGVAQVTSHTGEHHQARAQVYTESHLEHTIYV